MHEGTSVFLVYVLVQINEVNMLHLAYLNRTLIEHGNMRLLVNQIKIKRRQIVCCRFENIFLI